VYARYLHGVMADEHVDLDTFRGQVEQLAQSALDAVNRLP
jgi:hypothetical protein